MTAIRKIIRDLGSRLLGWAGPNQSSEPCRYCLVGNIVSEHEFGEAREILSGTKHFTPGTKVYCLPPQWGDGYEKTIAVGICRKSRRWITVVMGTDRLTNWRVKIIHQPAVLRQLRAGFDGFNAQWKSRKEAESWAVGLRKRDGKTS